jgi:lysozyme family protein
MTQDAQKYDPVFLEAVERVLANEGGYVNNPRLSADEKRAILADNALRFFQRIAA